MSQTKKQMVAPLIEQLLETVMQEGNWQNMVSTENQNPGREISMQIGRMIEKLQAKQNFS